MEQPVTAIYDANVLYPAPLRDLFIRLAQSGLVQAKWTDTIHDEWVRNVLKDNPGLPAGRLERTRTLMNDAVRDCLVTGYEDLIASLFLPDPDDRHVLAAAIRAGARVIVTFNLKDFPPETLAQFDIEPQHPDDFLVGLLDQCLVWFALPSNGSERVCETRPSRPTNSWPPWKAKALPNPWHAFASSLTCSESLNKRGGRIPPLGILLRLW